MLWAAAAAAILGVLVAAATSGSAPGVLLAALIVVPVALTLVLRARRSRFRRQRCLAASSGPSNANRRGPATGRRFETNHPSGSSAASGDHGGRQYDSPSISTFGLTEPLGRADWQAIGTLCAALDDQQVDWLRTNDYVIPWLDRRARVVIDLAPLLASVVDRPFDWGIRSALLVLSDALEPFVACYNDYTAPDPLLSGEEWRFFDRDELTSSGESRQAMSSGRDVRFSCIGTPLAWRTPTRTSPRSWSPTRGSCASSAFVV